MLYRVHTLSLHLVALFLTSLESLPRPFSSNILVSFLFFLFSFFFVFFYVTSPLNLTQSKLAASP